MSGQTIFTGAWPKQPTFIRKQKTILPSLTQKKVKKTLVRGNTFKIVVGQSR